MPIAYIWITISTLISVYILLNSRRFDVLNWVDFPLSRSDDPMMAAAAWCEYEIFVLNILYYIAVNLVLAFLAFMGQYWYAQYLKAKIRRRGPE